VPNSSASQTAEAAICKIADTEFNSQALVHDRTITAQ